MVPRLAALAGLVLLASSCSSPPAGAAADAAVDRATDHATDARAAADAPVDAGIDATPPATTYYVDSVAGDNTNPGTSPQRPWRDFARITSYNASHPSAPWALGPGERLLLKRGSVFAGRLELTARGTTSRWAEIGAYGTGPRPILRGGWHLSDWMLLVRDPDHLRISSLTLSHAGMGLLVRYSAGTAHSGLKIEDVVVHHIEGLYQNPRCSGIPEWYDAAAKTVGDSIPVSAGIGIAGPAQDVTVKDCDVSQTSTGFYIDGVSGLTVDRVYCHDNYVLNTSPHPFLKNVTSSTVKNSVFRAAGYHASDGTMGLLLANPRQLTIRNCTFSGMPDSGSHDEGGLDFERDGDGCLVDGCTFRDNAGAAIEVLGIDDPQTINIKIQGSRFIKDNSAQPFFASEIGIWGSAENLTGTRRYARSTGTIQDNGYVLAPGVSFFFQDKAKALGASTHWTLSNNNGYGSEAELEQAMPQLRLNNPPSVEAGASVRTSSTTVKLAGAVVDDGRPAGSSLKRRWEVLEGPGVVTLQDASDPLTVATFSQPGDYVLRLVGDDGELWTSDTVEVHVLPGGWQVAEAWEFSGTLEKEGWTEANLVGKYPDPDEKQIPCLEKRAPVKYVAGGHYIVSLYHFLPGTGVTPEPYLPDPYLLSRDNLGIDINENHRVWVRLQNSTDTTQLSVYFTTDTDGAFDETKRMKQTITARDTAPQLYEVDLSSVPNGKWAGKLRRLRLDLDPSAPIPTAALTGTVRVDYVWIGKR